MKKYMLVALATAVAVLSAVVFGLYQLCGASTQNMVQVIRLVGTMRFIDSRYVDEVPFATLIDGAIDGMMQSLGDKHSIYMDSKKFKQLMQQNEGSFGGIGVVMGFPGPGQCQVMSVMENTPGEAAGLQPEDFILKVDGVDVKELQPEEVAQRVRGDEGTQVVLTIGRKGQDDFEVSITRAVISMTTAKGVMLQDTKIGYIRVASFSEKTAKEFQTDLAKLKEEGMQGLIIDLRANPGGLITSCVDIANQVVPAGEIVSVVDRNGHREVFDSGLEDFGYPIVVLIDGNSASASEILAGAIQDRQCGTLVGTKSFGKGSVQTMVPLYDGDGIKLTVARYYTPSGRSIDGVGIEPDVAVELPEGSRVDVQLNKAIEVMKEKIGQ